MGTKWLLDLQNADGGWPTFCRGWGRLPFDRSGADLTAHALRALHAWRQALPAARGTRAVERGLRYLERVQRADGSWLALWFGNQDDPGEENPIYGTARVLLAFTAWQRAESAAAQRGLRWLAAAQNADGGWGGGAATERWQTGDRPSSVEETALAVEALLPHAPSAALQSRVERGLEWLIEAVEQGRWQECSPIGFYFAKLWYYEKLYPVVFTVSALGQAIRRGLPSHPDAGPLSRPLAC